MFIPPKTAEPSSILLENITSLTCPLEVLCILMHSVHFGLIHWCILDLVYKYNHCSECLQLIGLKKWLGQLGTQALILVKHVSGCACILSQPNNSQNPNKSQNPNNKTTKTVVGLRQTSRWEPPTTTTKTTTIITIKTTWWSSNRAILRK